MVDQWTVILLPVLCETVCAMGPLMARELSEEHRLLVTQQKLHIGATVTKDGTRAQCVQYMRGVKRQSTERHKKQILWSTSDPTSTLAL